MTAFRAATVLFLLVLASGADAQAPRVVEVSPAPGTITAARTADVSIRFDRAVDVASITDRTVRVFGRWSGPARGTLSVEEVGQVVRFRPDRMWMAGETVTVSISRGVTASGVAMERPHALQFWARAEAQADRVYAVGDWIEVREPGEGQIVSYGAYAGDLDGDGDSDLAVPNELPADVRVFLNDGTGRYSDFETYVLPNGDWPSPSEGADLDHDGLVDIVVGNGQNDQLSVLMGDGAGSFSSVLSYPATGDGVRGLAVIDTDGDGHDDVITANRDTGNLSLFMGRGDGTFDAPTSMDPGGFGATALASGDADGDGILDLFVGAIGSDEIILMLGDGAGGFTESDRLFTDGASWMLASGDLNGDGYADVVSAGSHADVVDVVYSDGQGGLIGGTSLPTGRLTIAVDLGDLDGNGTLDLVSSNYLTGDFWIFDGDGAGGFTERQRLEIDGAGSCAVLHDRDGDGILDLTAIDEVRDRIYLIESSVQTATAPGATPEAGLRLLGPNPASGDVQIGVRVASGESVRVSVLDVLGREVALLHDGASPPDVLTWTGQNTPPGLYVVRMIGSSARGSVRVTRL